MISRFWIFEKELSLKLPSDACGPAHTGICVDFAPRQVLASRQVLAVADITPYADHIFVICVAVEFAQTKTILTTDNRSNLPPVKAVEELSEGGNDPWISDLLYNVRPL